MGLLYGLAALIAIWWAAKLFAGSNPAALASAFKKVGGVASMGLAAFLLVRGRLDMAFLVGGFGAWLLGWAYAHPFAQWTRNGKATPGKVTKVASRLVEMELDHDSGDMRGLVIDGAFKGRELAGMSAAELEALMQEAAVSDADALRLLEAYLDRRFPGGREHAQADRDARQGGAGKAGAMSKQEAYDILGIQPGASEEAIRQAHRSLIKRLHPDTGGSSALAARVNEAKDVLLK